MHLQTQEQCDAIAKRFYEFYDGVLRNIRVVYQGRGEVDLEVELSSRDAETTEDEGWVCVRICVRNVREFGIREGEKTTNRVLSQGVHIQKFSSHIAIEFGGQVESPLTLDDLRMSDAFAVGSAIELTVMPH